MIKKIQNQTNKKKLYLPRTIFFRQEEGSKTLQWVHVIK